MERVRKLANDGNHRALALCGLLAARREDSASAIRFLELSMKGAVALANEKIDHKKSPFLAAQQHDELSSPWNDLAVQYYNVGRYADADMTFKLGMDLDDPHAFYTRAWLERKDDPEYTPRWLHDMTKAAATGHVLAAVEVAKYYADAEAYPPSDTSNSWTDLLNSFLKRPTVSSDSADNMEHYASLAQTPVERIKHSFAWLDIARQYMYAPAMLHAARLHLNKYLFASNNLGLVFQHPDQQKIDDLDGGVENPHYDVSKAMKCLSEIFDVHARSQEASRETDPQAVRKILGTWLTYPDVHDMFASPEQIHDLVTEAQAIADTAGIDVMSDENELQYNHQGIRGKGVAENAWQGPDKEGLY